jgi:UDP-N-acetylmuramate--alanine ligase
VHYVTDFDAVPQVLVDLARPGDLVLTLGAGDVTELGPRVLDLLSGRAVDGE